MRPELAMAGSADVHINVPRPLPDELLASAFARFANHHAIVGAKPLAAALFNLNTTSISWLFPTRLERLRWLIVDRWNMEVEDAALRHTLLPLFLWAHAPQTAAAERLLKVALRDRASQLHKTLGLTVSRLHRPDVLRYCHVCVAEDRARYGEAYWHRHHQAPGVFVCAKHHAPLNLSQARLQSQRRRPPIAPDAIVNLAEDACEPVAPDDLSRAIEYAKAVRDVLNSEGQPAQRPDCGSPLAAHGFTGKRGGVQRLQRSFIAYWGAAFLRRIELDFDAVSGLAWLGKIAHKRARLLHPVRLLLLSRFLSSLPPLSQDDGFSPPPWRCPNWLAPHYGQAVVVNYECVYDHRRPDRTIRRFTCSCGFVFTRYARSLPEDCRVVAFGALFPEEAIKLARLGLSTAAIASALGVDWATADRFLRLNGERPLGLDDRNGRQKDRADWLVLREQFPRDGAKALRARDPALYARLYRRDRDWLRTHMPQRSVPARCKRRVNWAQRDELLSREIRQAARHLLEKTPHRRVTQTALLALLGKQSTIEKNLVQLPKTQQALREVCETVGQYRVRRLRAAVESLGRNEPRWRIVRKSGLRPESITEAMFNLAGVESSGDPGSGGHG